MLHSGNYSVRAEAVNEDLESTFGVEGEYLDLDLEVVGSQAQAQAQVVDQSSAEFARGRGLWR